MESKQGRTAWGSFMEDILQRVSDIEFYQKLLQKWKSAPTFLRITTLVTGSIAGLSAAWYVYVKSKRKYYGYPPGPIGIAGLFKRFDIEWLYTVPEQYGSVTNLGGIILVNEPVLAKKLHDDPRAMNSMFSDTFLAKTTGFLQNGKPWFDRRRIIQSNLMSTMKGEFVERATTGFVSSKVLPLIDRDIADGKVTELKPLLMPIGFNIVLQACYGKELESLDDQLWAEWERIVDELNKQIVGQMAAIVLTNSMDSKLSVTLQKWFTGMDFMTAFMRKIDFVDKLESAKDVDAEKDDDVRLFSDFIDDYVKMENGKYTKKQLQGDMMTMFSAAVDTTYTAISFALLTLARKQELQQELSEEVIKAFGDDFEGIKLKRNITKIPKLRAFIHEVLRVYPPLPATGLRKILDEGVTVGPYNLPLGARPMINAAAIHHNPKYWIKDYNEEKHGDVNMNDIHLEFWMEDGVFLKKLQSDNFFTFHSGKRDCAGQTLAMKELIIILAMVLMKYTVESVDKSKEDRIAWKIANGGIIEPKESLLIFMHKS